MMKLVRNLVFVLLFSLSVTTPAYADGGSAKAQMIGTMALYGTAGGFLLGAASMAFGAHERSMAIGASLGLYSGLLFGAYIVASHAAKRNNWGLPSEIPDEYYDNAGSPYSVVEPSLESVRVADKQPVEAPLFYSNFFSYSF